MCGDEIRNESILCAIILLNRRPNRTLQLLVPELRRIPLGGHGMTGPFGGRREVGRLFLDVFAPGDVGEVVLIHDANIRVRVYVCVDCVECEVQG